MTAPTGEVERVAAALDHWGKLLSTRSDWADVVCAPIVMDEAAAMLRSLAKDAARLELALATERGKLEKADAVADKWARDARRWQKLMQVVKPDDLLPFDSVFSETSWGHVIGYRECWAEFDAAIDRAIEAAGRKEGKA
jgi:hypothetical protein